MQICVGIASEVIGGIPRDSILRQGSADEMAVLLHRGEIEDFLHWDLAVENEIGVSVGILPMHVLDGNIWCAFLPAARCDLGQVHAVASCVLPVAVPRRARQGPLLVAFETQSPRDGPSGRPCAGNSQKPFGVRVLQMRGLLGEAQKNRFEVPWGHHAGETH